VCGEKADMTLPVDDLKGASRAMTFSTSSEATKQAAPWCACREDR
jgi:hypothetical protein